MKTAREQLDIITTYEETGSLRATAELCGTTHKTVGRIIAKHAAGVTTDDVPRTVEHNYDLVRDLVIDRVDATRGRITAKRLLPKARAAGYAGSDRNFRRLVAEVKAQWRRTGRVFRPWVHSPGQHLIFDWAEHGRWKIFCAVLAWSRVRFVRLSFDMSQDTTLRMLAECFEQLGGVPAVALTDRMGCLRGQIVANQVVPNAGYVRFATHYGFRPDWCEAEDPQSKGIVENLAGYAQTDLLVPNVDEWDGDLSVANDAARAWCEEVNGAVHSEVAAIPTQRLVEERKVLKPLPSLRPPLRRGVGRKVDRMATVRFGSARYSVPASLVGTSVEVAAEDTRVVIYLRDDIVAVHPLIAPGEVSINDDHYGGPRRQPARAVRPRSEVERAFLQLGPVAEDFLRAAAAAGTNKLPGELAAIVELTRAWTVAQVVAALERGLTFRRFTANDIRSILTAGAGVAQVVNEGVPVDRGLPQVAVRDLSAYAIAELA